MKDTINKRKKNNNDNTNIIVDQEKIFEYTKQNKQHFLDLIEKYSKKQKTTNIETLDSLTPQAIEQLDLNKDILFSLQLEKQLEKLVDTYFLTKYEKEQKNYSTTIHDFYANNNVPRNTFHFVEQTRNLLTKLKLLEEQCKSHLPLSIGYLSRERQKLIDSPYYRGRGDNPMFKLIKIEKHLDLIDIDYNIHSLNCILDEEFYLYIKDETLSRFDRKNQKITVIFQGRKHIFQSQDLYLQCNTVRVSGIARKNCIDICIIMIQDDNHTPFITIKPIEIKIDPNHLICVYTMMAQKYLALKNMISIQKPVLRYILFNYIREPKFAKTIRENKENETSLQRENFAQKLKEITLETIINVDSKDCFISIEKYKFELSLTEILKQYHLIDRKTILSFLKSNYFSMIKLVIYFPIIQVNQEITLTDLGTEYSPIKIYDPVIKKGDYVFVLEHDLLPLKELIRVCYYNEGTTTKIFIPESKISINTLMKQYLSTILQCRSTKNIYLNETKIC